MRCWTVARLPWLAQGVARLQQRVLLALASVMTVLLWPLLARRRRIAAINLKLCFPDQSRREQRRLLRATLRATTMGVFELLRAWYAPAGKIATLGDIEGLERLREALARGQGVLLFTGHFTGSELVGRMIGEALGRPVRVVVRPNNNECLERWLDAARERVFGPTIGKKDTRALLRALRSGEVVAYSADQNFTYQNAFVPFFGVPAATLVSTPELLRRANACMLPFWFHRDDDGRYHVRIEAAWPGWSDADPATAAAIYMRELEAVVREHPEQYLWVHRRFKTRPPGEPDLY